MTQLFTARITQCQTTWKKHSTAEITVVHKFGMETVYSLLKYRSLNFEQKQPNRNFRPPVDLRRINSLILVDYTNRNHP